MLFSLESLHSYVKAPKIKGGKIKVICETKSPRGAIWHSKERNVVFIFLASYINHRILSSNVFCYEVFVYFDRGSTSKREFFTKSCLDINN